MRQVINAHAFANAIGKPLTAHCTILLERSRQFDPSPENWMRWQGRFLEKVSRWFRREDDADAAAYIWTREVGPRKGAHLHLLVHLDDFDLRDDLRRFIHETGDFIPDDAAGRAVVIQGGDYGMRVATMQMGALKYVTKGVEPALGAKLRIRPEPSLPFVGRRFGIAHAIGPSERAAAGWREVTDLTRLASYINP